MSELRKDPLSRRWVIIASERARRPSDFVVEEPAQIPGFDPFAEGNEDKTPPEIAAYRTAGSRRDGPGWRVRVVPNKFPALAVEGKLQKHGSGPYDRMHGIGAHEIVIECPQTLRSFTGLPDAHVQEILWMYRDRLVDLARDRRFRYGMIFKNVGKVAGGTLYHTHSQLIATPVVPRTVALKMEHCAEYFKLRERCLIQDIVDHEIEEQSRVVLDTGHFLSFAPYAPRFPFETWIVPKFPAAHFESIEQGQMEELAFVLKRTLLKLERGLGNPPYNYMLFTAPFHDPPNESFRWHLEITPRLTHVAGFEWGTGFYINPVPPEDAAEFLRNLKL
ncbi:MAG: galactose-1-phosphate uridylyltransferase [Planctomycetota bacterium]